MTLEHEILDLNTNYFKFGHLQNVRHRVYTNIKDNEQALLELELKIRHQNPKILLTYYNKSLFHFAIDDGSNFENFVEVYDNLKIQHEAVTAVEVFANVANMAKAGNSSSDKHLVLANLSFLRAVKKLVLYNLCLKSTFRLFGNQCVFSSDGIMYTPVCLDPVLLENGELLVSITERKSLSLYSSIILSPEEFIQAAHNLVLYILPSGIRCHLFDPTNIENNFVTSHNIKNDNLLKLLELSIPGTDFSQERKWVKLIPNLKHLNNQTSLISKFIHSVENTKYILWPWSLCFLQFGLNEETELASNAMDTSFPLSSSSPSSNSPAHNPIDFISDYLDFVIDENEKEQAVLKASIQIKNEQASKGSAATATGAAPVAASVTGDSYESKDATAHTLNDPHARHLDFNLTTSPGFETFDLRAAETFLADSHVVGNGDENKDANATVKSGSDAEMDDLFGDDESENADDKPKDNTIKIDNVNEHTSHSSPLNPEQIGKSKSNDFENEDVDELFGSEFNEDDDAETEKKS